MESTHSDLRETLQTLSKRGYVVYDVPCQPQDTALEIIASNKFNWYYGSLEMRFSIWYGNDGVCSATLTKIIHTDVSLSATFLRGIGFSDGTKLGNSYEYIQKETLGNSNNGTLEGYAPILEIVLMMSNIPRTLLSWLKEEVHELSGLLETSPLQYYERMASTKLEGKEVKGSYLSSLDTFGNPYQDANDKSVRTADKVLICNKVVAQVNTKYYHKHSVSINDPSQKGYYYITVTCKLTLNGSLGSVDVLPRVKGFHISKVTDNVFNLVGHRKVQAKDALFVMSSLHGTLLVLVNSIECKGIDL